MRHLLLFHERIELSIFLQLVEMVPMLQRLDVTLLQVDWLLAFLNPLFVFILEPLHRLLLTALFLHRFPDRLLFTNHSFDLCQLLMVARFFGTLLQSVQLLHSVSLHLCQEFIVLDLLAFAFLCDIFEAWVKIFLLTLQIRNVVNH